MARFLEVFFGGICRLFGLAAGCFVFCRRAAFEASGGFDENVYAGEEWLFSHALKKQGRFVMLRQSVTTSARKLNQFTPWQLALEMTLGALGGFRRRSRLWYDVAEPQLPGPQPPGAQRPGQPPGAQRPGQPPGAQRPEP